MSIIRVTKKFDFEMAHALWNYDGLCSNIHGHSYKLAITITGKPNDDQTSPKYGMVIDFNVLKKIVKDNILDKYDHALVVSNKVPAGVIKEAGQMFERLRVLEGQPTCENLLIEFAGTLKEKLPANNRLHSMHLSETNTSYAEWYADDNDK